MRLQISLASQLKDTASNFNFSVDVYGTSCVSYPNVDGVYVPCFPIHRASYADCTSCCTALAHAEKGVCYITYTMQIMTADCDVVWVTYYLPLITCSYLIITNAGFSPSTARTAPTTAY